MLAKLESGPYRKLIDELQLEKRTDVRFGSTAVLSLWSLIPASFLIRIFGSVITGSPLPTEQPLAVRPQLPCGVNVAITGSAG